MYICRFLQSSFNAPVQNSKFPSVVKKEITAPAFTKGEKESKTFINSQYFT